MVQNICISVGCLLMAVALASSAPSSSANKNKVSCKDENGKNVDWFYAYKLPRAFGTTAESRGLEFVYVKSTDDPAHFSWKLSNVSITDPQSIIGQTVAQALPVALEANKRLVAAYNDEPAVGKMDGGNGHSKGLLVADEKSGYWLIHSVPKFPNIDGSEYTYPLTGNLYGQSILCLSVNADQVNVIGKQMLYNEANIYSIRGNDIVNKLYPNVVDASNKLKIRKAPFFSHETIVSAGGVEFKSFAKTRRYGEDLYDDMVAPALGSSLYTQTWRHGTGLLASECSKKTEVLNISQVKIAPIDLAFPTTNDHSKWGVTSAGSNWVCVGDVNRGLRQKSRGGGTVCQKSPVLANLYRSMVVDFEPCTRA